MTEPAVMENVRRYRAIASLCRQSAAFRPIQRDSLLAQAAAWEERAIAELERYFSPRPHVSVNGSGRFADPRSNNK
ncbi:hypothetical protein [Bradyrhizobium shewense]|uniref:hypothetical protein n=1 Tax=Bradyrhizobium shewense TaxID=1761772 RepID=UPI000B835034|nr:hypothetical protein [Bradyrhizobium shewense]